MKTSSAINSVDVHCSKHEAKSISVIIVLWPEMAQAKPAETIPRLQEIVDNYLYARADAKEPCDYNLPALKKHIDWKCKQLGFTNYKVTDVKSRYHRWVSKVRGIYEFAMSDIVQGSTVSLPFHGTARHISDFVKIH